MPNYVPLIGSLSAIAFSAVALADEGKQDPRVAIAAQLPAVSAEDINDSPIDGIYEIALGSQVAYISADGRYLFTGDIIDLKRQINLTDARRNDARVEALGALGENKMIVFSPESKPKHSISVFTDIDCGFCRKLHGEMGQLNELGVEVRYLFYPRQGPGTESWAKADHVWCAPDRQTALTRAKQGEQVESKSCDTPVSTHYEMAQQVGLRGTPAIVTEDGTLLSGYLPAKDLLAQLDYLAKQK